MAETKNEITGALRSSSIAATAEKEPKETDIYSTEMLKELEKRNKAVKTALSGIKKNIEKAVFNLYWIYQTGMYKTMGFDSITDYAAAEFDFSKSTTYDFISLAERFGKRDEDGKIQEAIDDRYKEYSSSKLTAMANLEDTEIESSGITPEMSVRDIKKAVKRTLGSTGSQSKTMNEPSDSDITAFYEYGASEYDNDRNQLAEQLKERFGKSYYNLGGGDLELNCTPRGISINDCKVITWKQYVKRLNDLIPVQSSLDLAFDKFDSEPEPKTIQSTDNWIPCSEMLPEKISKDSSLIERMVLVTREEGFVDLLYFRFDAMKFYDLNYVEVPVIAWQPLPEPYKQKGGN